jgi:hypothetical protein
MRSTRWLDPKPLALGIAAFALITLARLEYALDFLGGGLAGALLALIMLLALVLLGLGAVRKSRPLIIVSTYLLVAMIASIVLGSVILEIQERRSFERGDRIAAALASFYDVAVRYPNSLSELAPAHLERVPATSMGVFRRIEFSYAADPSGADYRLGFPAPAFIYCRRTASRSEWVCRD